MSIFFYQIFNFTSTHSTLLDYYDPHVKIAFIDKYHMAYIPVFDRKPTFSHEIVSSHRIQTDTVLPLFHLVITVTPALSYQFHAPHKYHSVLHILPGTLTRL